MLLVLKMGYGSRLLWSVLSPAHVLVSGSLSDPLYPGMGTAPRSCLDHGIAFAWKIAGVGLDTLMIKSGYLII